jgi:hypothetical protein
MSTLETAELEVRIADLERRFMEIEAYIRSNTKAYELMHQSLTALLLHVGELTKKVKG